MNLILSTASIKQLSDGIILLDRSGQPREANAAAQPWLRRCIQLTPQWARHAAQEKAGAVQLPVAVDIDADGEDTPAANIQLLKNGNNGYALLIQAPPVVRPRQRDSRRSGFLALLGGEVRGEMSRFNALLHECRDPIALNPDLMRHAERLEALLAEVGDLAELDQLDEVFGDERLALVDIVRAVLPELPQSSGASEIQYTLSESGEAPAPVYGNRRWLQRALHTLLARLARDCPGHGRVAIDLRQIGDFLVLNARATTDAAGWRALPAAEAGVQPADALRGETCRRIIELHGGQLKLGSISKETAPEGVAGAIDSIILTLPTGVPAGDRSRISCAECRITQQAMQYARDLAEIMAGGVANHKPSKVNPP